MRVRGLCRPPRQTKVSWLFVRSAACHGTLHAAEILVEQKQTQARCVRSYWLSSSLLAEAGLAGLRL